MTRREQNRPGPAFWNLHGKGPANGRFSQHLHQWRTMPSVSLEMYGLHLEVGPGGPQRSPRHPIAPVFHRFWSCTASYDEASIAARRAIQRTLNPGWLRHAASYDVASMIARRVTQHALDPDLSSYCDIHGIL